MRAAAALVATGWGASAFAASFDCAQATRPVEVAICANARLSALDVQVAQGYQRALQVLSAQGANQLRTSQRSWLRYVNLVCLPPPGRDRPAKVEADPDCLEEELQHRVDSLRQAGLRLGTLVLTRVDRYDAFPSPPGDDTGHRTGMVLRHVGYPQIDAADAAAAAWNRARARALPVEDPRQPDPTDYETDYSIGCANENLVSILEMQSEYGHGAPHGLYANSALTFLLKPTIRPMRAGDLLAPGSHWQRRLPKLFWDAYLRDENADKENERLEAIIRAAALETQRWLLTPAGLQLNFSAYEGGSYAGTPGPITVPWAALQSLLVGKRAPSCQVSFVPGH
jgi:uncharacterized protein YecT (DUF1311 family)